jgi:hypothetical protein
LINARIFLPRSLFSSSSLISPSILDDIRLTCDHQNVKLCGSVSAVAMSLPSKSTPVE